MKLRKDLIEALGRECEFTPIFTEREWITGRYAMTGNYTNTEVYFKAYHRSSNNMKKALKEGWVVEKPVIENFIKYSHAQAKVFIFVGESSTIEFFILNVSQFLERWDGIYQIAKYNKTTTFNNRDEVDKPVVYITMEFCESRGFIHLTPMNVVQVDKKVFTNIEDMKLKSKSLF